MADRNDSDASPNTDTFPSAEWCAQQWSVLCDVLGTNDPQEVVPRVRTLKDNMDAIDEEGSRGAPEGLVTISEVEEVFQEMHQKLTKLRERNAALVERLEGEGDAGVQSAFKELHTETESLLEELGVTSMDEAKDRIRSLNKQLDNLYREKETLIEAGLTSADEALEEIHRLQDERDDLKQKLDAADPTDPDALADLRRQRDAAREERDDLAAQVETLRAEAKEAAANRDELDDGYQQLEQRYTSLEQEHQTLTEQHTALQNDHDALQQAHEALQEEHDALQDRYRALQDEKDALETEHADLRETHQTLREDHNALRRKHETLEERMDSLRTSKSEVEDRLSSVAGARDQAQSEVQSLQDRLEDVDDKRAELQSRLDRLQTERNRLQQENKQLKEKTSRRPDTSVFQAASSIRSVVGVSSPEEAEQLANGVKAMHRRLQQVMETQDRIAEEAGVDDATDVLAMIDSMREQLEDLYRERESDAPEARIPEEVADVLGISTPDQARDLAQTVRRMGERLDRMRAEQNRIAEETGVTTADDALAMIQSMEAQLEDLYREKDRQNSPSGDGTVAPPATDESEGESEGEDMMPAAVGRVLGVETVDEARELEKLVHGMSSQLESLTEKHAKLEEAGLTPEQALAMIDTMEEQLVDLYGERELESSSDAEDALLGDLPLGDAPGEEDSDDAAGQDASEPSASAEDDLDTQVAQVLGVETRQEAEELSALVHSMADRLNELTEEHQKLMDIGLSVDNAVTMIETMEEQLVDLYQDRESQQDLAGADDIDALRSQLDELRSILGVSTPNEARALESTVKSMSSELQTLLNEKRGILEETGVSSVQSVIDMITSMEDQLVDLYQQQDAGASGDGPAAERLSEIKDVLGISTRKEAEELATIAQHMNQQLNDLYEDKEKLNAIGLDSIEDAVNMIESMEEQLVELYQDKESVQDMAAIDIDPEQDTFGQLQALYAEREKLERELGVSSADEIIEMVEGLATQLDDFYRDRDVEVGRSAFDTLDDTTSPGAAPTPSDDDAATMLESMRGQLESLYEEKEALLKQGMGDAREAVARIEELRDQVAALQQTKTAYEQRFNRLESKLGTSSVTHILQTIDRLKQDTSPREAVAKTPTPPNEPAKGSSDGGDADSDSTSGSVINAAPQFADDDVLARLEDMNTSELDALDFGAIRLSDRGRVEYVNEAGLQLPGLKAADNQTTLTGKNFFFDLAPSTNNNLFFGRFKEGLRQGAMDARFPYTFISPGRGPTVLLVHLHRKANEKVNWLLFKPM